MNYNLIPIGRFREENGTFLIEVYTQYRRAMEGLHEHQYLQVLWWFDRCDNTESRNKLIEEKPYTPSVDRVENVRVPQWCEQWPKSVESSGDFDWSAVFNF